MKRTWFSNIFLAPPDEGGGSGALDLLDAPMLDVEKEEPKEVTNPTKEEPKAPAFDPKAMAAAFADGLKTAGFSAPVAQQAPAMTAEEAKKLLNVWDPSDEFVTKFGNIDTQKAAIAEMRDGIIKQMDTIAQLRMQEMAQQYEGRLEPLQQYVSSQEATARESRFHTTFPDLAKPELQPLINTVIQGLAQSKQLDPSDEKKTFQTIATAVESVIAQAQPGFKLTPGGSTPTGQKPNNSNALSATTSGSGGGGGGKGSADVSGKPKAMQFL
jgi:hypothetical protein